MLAEVIRQMKKTQRVHVGIWYILRAQRGSHIPILKAKYIPYSYMDPLGKEKAPGPDGVRGELLKSLEHVNEQLLLDLFNDCLSQKDSCRHFDL